jgi:HEAT repeat protein
MPLIRKDLTAASPSIPRSAAEILHTGTTDERWHAARALGLAADTAGRTGEREAAPGEIMASGALRDGTKILAEALKTETDLRVREAIFTSLVRIGSQECVDAVIPCLRGDDAALRTGALDALRAMIGAVRPVLPALLADPDADIRLLACDLARELPSAEATSLLCDVLSRETEANVCAAAVDVLADVGGAEALPVLQATAARFGDVTFLNFAVKIAMERILAEHPVRHA